MFGLCFGMLYIVSFLVILNHLDKEERDGCFASIVFLMSCDCKYFVALPHGHYVGIQCVIVVFPDPTHLLFTCTNCSPCILLLFKHRLF